MPGLDRYEGVGLDNRQYGAMDATARREAEAALAARERASKRSRLAGAGGAGLAEAESEDGAPVGAEELRAQIRDRKELAAMGGVEGGDEGENILAAIGESGASVREWAATDMGERHIYNQFQRLLTETTDATGAAVYEQKINEMCAENKQTLEVSWLDMQTNFNQLAVILADAPKPVLKVFDEAAKSIVLGLYSDYSSIHDEIHVRITDIPLHDSLRELRQVHLNALVQVTGVVTRRSVVFPQLKIVRFTCQNCNHLTPQMYTHEGSEVRRCVVPLPAPRACPRSPLWCVARLPGQAGVMPGVPEQWTLHFELGAQRVPQLSNADPAGDARLRARWPRAAVQGGYPARGLDRCGAPRRRSGRDGHLHQPLRRVSEHAPGLPRLLDGH